MSSTPVAGWKECGGSDGGGSNRGRKLRHDVGTFLHLLLITPPPHRTSHLPARVVESVVLVLLPGLLLSCGVGAAPIRLGRSVDDLRIEVRG